MNLNVRKGVVSRRGPGKIGTWVLRIPAKLSPAGAAALNRAFGTRDFRAGTNLGRVNIKSEPAQVLLRGGSTTLVLSPEAIQSLIGLGAQVGSVPPATTDASGNESYPVTGGKVTLRGPSGTIEHRGGLAISIGAVTVQLTNFIINIDRQPDLTALVNGANRASQLNLDLSQSTVGVSNRQLRANNVPATLTGIAAAGLNGAFGVSGFEPDFPIGTAQVRAQIV
jgi:hypothetical protein